MKKSVILVAMVLGIALMFVAGSIYAGTKAPDVIKMENKIYKKHKKGIVEFHHKKHAAEYKATCGDCHHDDKGKPRANLKDGDTVKGCAECHKKPGELKGKKAKGKKPAELMAYHANALHKNCKGCHKAFNKKNKTKAAPTTCSKCHPKKKK